MNISNEKKICISVGTEMLFPTNQIDARLLGNCNINLFGCDSHIHTHIFVYLFCFVFSLFHFLSSESIF
uniref:Uncharacterized protein n=1 Tax=Octopus bimaculoides TaxID=37653 RepID=A0A0L8ID73_OCTBM